MESINLLYKEKDNISKKEIFKIISEIYILISPIVPHIVEDF